MSLRLEFFPFLCDLQFISSLSISVPSSQHGSLLWLPSGQRSILTVALHLSSYHGVPRSLVFSLFIDASWSLTDHGLVLIVRMCSTLEMTYLTVTNVL